MAIFTDEEKALECTVTDTECLWKKNVIKIENGYLVSKGLVTNVRIPLHHVDTVVYSMNPKKPALVPGLKIVGKGVILAEMDISAEYIETVQDWLLQVIEKA
ncbi:hypothetical protein CD798_06110 [Bacillaceae bacterium SAOS 7]|nr:hypothetical protein CEW92_04270 [Bacillaceae bacterium SAS-127]PAQ15361.1 hypothetical protein CD798_06110 [Bacillaceae bacterium SAOS 7]